MDALSTDDRVVFSGKPPAPASQLIESFLGYANQHPEEWNDTAALTLMKVMRQNNLMRKSAHTCEPKKIGGRLESIRFSAGH